MNTSMLRWALALLFGLLASAAFAQALEIRGLVLAVSDLERSVAFYEQALGFRTVAQRSEAGRRSATLQLGEETIALEAHPGGRPLSAAARANDLWFQHFAVVVRDMDKAYAHLQRVPFQAISSAPQTIPASNAAAAGIRAFKFRDPDGHPLELLYFPPGKGDPKWQRPTPRLFLGIDHSAITVASTERSLAFYRDLLGLRVAGQSVNTGETQERLDAAPGAMVRVTGLRPGRVRGPGLEFLHYLAPADGRSAPRQEGTAPVRITLEVDGLEHLGRTLAERGSPVSAPSDCAPFGACLLVRDPDGHALLLVRQ